MLARAAARPVMQSNAVPNDKCRDLECRPSDSTIQSANLKFNDLDCRLSNDFPANDDEKPQSLLSEIPSDDINGIIK